MSDENSQDAMESLDDAEDVAAEAAALALEVHALKEQVLRYAADAENTKRRAEREANDARAYAIQKFARDLLGVADNLDRAMAAAPSDHSDMVVNNYVVGVEMTAKELLSAFERNGLKKVTPAAGDKFDPHKHQAMMEQPGSGVTPGGIVQVMQPGYELLGRLVRPAMVIVAARGAANADTPGGYSDEGDAKSGDAVDTRA